MIVPIFLTGLGCQKEPCIFCNQEITTSKEAVATEEFIKRRIEETLKEYLSGKNIDYPVEVALYGSSFTVLSFSYQKEILKFIQETFEKITEKDCKTNLKIRVATRPDNIKKEELLDLKIRFNLYLIELGVQSMNDDVLFLANRGHTKNDVIKAAKDIKKIGIDLSCHQMIGLPGSNAKIDIATAREIAKLKPKYVRIHPTLVLKGTMLERMYLSGKYTPLSLEEAINVTEKVLGIYRNDNIGVIRVSLHPAEFLEKNIVAGPWHPAFRELVEGRYIMNMAKSKLSKYRNQKVQLSIDPKDETYIRGKDNSNLNSMINEFELEDVVIVKDPKINRGTIAVSSLSE